jgi:hypothetical protein
LQCGYKSGTDRLYLRLPQEVVHPIDDASPLASWLQPGGLSGDADSEIVVLVSVWGLAVRDGNVWGQRGVEWDGWGARKCGNRPATHSAGHLLLLPGG